MAITNYNIIIAANLKALAADVCAAIKQGWEPVGAAQPVPNQAAVYQTVVQGSPAAEPGSLSVADIHGLQEQLDALASFSHVHAPTEGTDPPPLAAATEDGGPTGTEAGQQGDAQQT